MALSPIVAGHLMEVVVYTSFRAQVGMNVLHFKVNTVTADTTPDDYVLAVEADFNGSWKAWMNNQARWKGISLRDLTVAPREVAAFAGAQEGPGTAGDPIPGQVSGLITLKTNVAGPRGRGRIYPPFPGLSMLNTTDDDGGLSATGDTTLQALIDDIKGPEAVVATPNTMNWSLVLRTQSDLLVTSLPLRSITGSEEFATQMRRAFYGRTNTLPSELQ